RDPAVGLVPHETEVGQRGEPRGVAQMQQAQVQARVDLVLHWGLRRLDAPERIHLMRRARSGLGRRLGRQKTGEEGQRNHQSNGGSPYGQVPSSSSRCTSLHHGLYPPLIEPPGPEATRWLVYFKQDCTMRTTLEGTLCHP